jgi:hypothetical protein
MSSNTDISMLVNPTIHTPIGGYYCRAKYCYDHEGRLILLSAEKSNHPVFNRQIVEKFGDSQNSEFLFEFNENESDKRDTAADNLRRSVNRAKVRAFDFIMCNPDLDAFATLTIDKERLDRTSWEKIYPKLRTWLSNRVTRNGLKYIICPEHHLDGEGIHFHMIANQSALEYLPALTPAGKIRYRKGKPIYNLSDWKYGFSTMQLVGRDDPRDAVAKYIFKYMGKNAGAMIGGRHFLHGGDLKEPIYQYADVLSDLPMVDASDVTFMTNFTPCEGLEYSKLYFK